MPDNAYNKLIMAILLAEHLGHESIMTTARYIGLEDIETTARYVGLD